MRTAYFDCFSGISGDMTLGALIACGGDPDALRDDLGRLGLVAWDLTVDTVERSGIAAVGVTVTGRSLEEHGRHLPQIESIIRAGEFADRVTSRAISVFRKLAEAEAAVHGTTADRIHFHEVGAVDAIVDIVGTALLLEQLGIDAVQCSPLPMGRGFVRCAHGVIPLPAPAVVELCRGVPCYGVEIEGELVTPTGAAIVASLADRWGAMATGVVQCAGYGAGRSTFGDKPNLLRIVITQSDTSDAPELAQVAVLQTSLDDMSPQLYDHACERLFEAGAVDVTLTSLQMKKNRPGTLITVLCAPERVQHLASVLFEHTTTLGVRVSTEQRLCMQRSFVTVGTAYGPVRVKKASWPGIRDKAMPEYADVAEAAQRAGVPLRDVWLASLSALGETDDDGRRA